MGGSYSSSIDVMKIFRNAVHLALSDTKARYNKSVLGPFWPVLTNCFGVLGLSLVWGNLLNQDMRLFVPQLAIGLVVWQLIAGVLLDSPICFTRQAGMIRNVAIPFWFFSIRLLARHLINMLHNAVIVIGIMLYYELPLQASAWLLIPSLVLVVFNLYWILNLVGLMGARFRDIEHFVNGVVPMLFFISPVIYRTDKFSGDINLVWLNPFSYMIEAIRAPLLGYPTDPKTWTVLTAMLIIGSSLTWLYQRL
jgi:ABC-type polysaccharide/polyol phosphate export permease